MPEEQRQILREHFLESFVRQLILNSYDPSKDQELQNELEKEKLAQVAQELKKKKGMPMLNLSEFDRRTSPSFPIAQPSPLQFPQMKMPLSPQRQQSPQPIPQANTIQLPSEMYKPSPPKPGQKPETVNLGKIASILTDPAVFSVECPGPYKNVLVNRGGSMQASSLTLTPEEIGAVMQNISDRTRIPLTNGVFKAAVQDLIITAVISEFVGTRFMIQKRTPFQKY